MVSPPTAVVLSTDFFDREVRRRVLHQSQLLRRQLSNSVPVGAVEGDGAVGEVVDEVLPVVVAGQVSPGVAVLQPPLLGRRREERNEVDVRRDARLGGTVLPVPIEGAVCRLSSCCVKTVDREPARGPPCRGPPTAAK